ncbi:HNH endonuclease [Bacillus sp. CGMCC 1.60114]|uniref:HNH endonuclease n=1 Tax=unclassified Bacillus (in: firmicutes) TaxID=185979 RepID=UPI00362DA975
MTNHKQYDKYQRNKEAKRFYNSDAWKRCRSLALIRDNHLCQECFKRDDITSAVMVHHIKEREDHPELSLVLDNLISLCNACHNKEHPEKGSGKNKKKKKQRIPVIKSMANKEMI